MNFLFFLSICLHLFIYFYQSTALSSRAVNDHQMYSGGLVLGKASTNSIEISPLPLIFTRGRGQKVRNLASFTTSLNFEPPAFENAARYLNAETNFLCRNDRPMFLPSLVKLGPRTPENLSVKVPHPLKLHGKTCYIVNNSAVDYSISLKFCTKFKRMTPELQ